MKKVDTSTENRVLRSDSRFLNHDLVSTREKSLKSSEAVLGTSSENASVNFRTNKTNRLNSSTIQPVLPGQINFRYPQQQQIKALRTQGSYCKKVILNRNSKEELQWWIQNLKICNGPYLIQSHSQVLIQTDASIKGWGAKCQGISTGGQWSKEEQLLHIAPSTFNKQKSLKAVHFQIENTTALLYLQMLLKLSKEIWQHLLKHQITITAEYIPSSLNVEAH